MTREEELIRKLLEEQKNEFESRTCDNCKHYITEYTTRDNHCGYDGMFEIAEMLRCTKDFGCNKWEKIEL